MREPEVGAEPIELSTSGNDESRWQMAGVTPIPPKEHLERLPNAHVPIDTWVELTLEDDQGKEHVVTRRLARAARTGKIEVTPPQLEALGLDPIAFDVGTRMSGLLPHIRLGAEPSDIGKAIAQLTGLAPLRDLSKHAAKAKEKLLKDLPRDRRAEIQEIDTAYNAEIERLVEIYRKQPSIVPADIETPNASEKDAAKRLESLKAHFDRLLTTAFGEAKELLGNTFDASNDAARKSLDRHLPLCKAGCQPAGLKKLKSVSRLGGLKKLTDKQINDASALIRSLLTEAREIIQLEQHPEEARRNRLYSGVGTWLRDNDPQSVVENCPLCTTDLTGIIDSVTERLVSDHLKLHRDTHTSHLSLTLNRWFEDARRRLIDQLPEALRVELNAKDTADPHRLMTDDLVNELFAEEFFSGPTAALKAATTGTADALKANLPPFKVEEIPDVPEQIKITGKDFLRMLENVSAAIAAARWRTKHESECSTLFNKLIGREPAPGQVPQQHTPGQRTLVDRLVALSVIIANAEPTTTASNTTEKLQSALRKRGIVESKLTTYDAAAKAIDPILSLGNLVDRQIESLRVHLHTETQAWKDHLYQPAFGNAVSPRLGATRIAPDGVITFQSETSGTRAPAHAIGNASDVRATLVAFLFSFWDYILNTRGGMSLLLLDDLQELFDPDNRRRLANALPKLIERGGRLLVTTNEPSHAGRISKFKDVTWREVKPVGPARPVVSLPPNETVIDRKRRAFEISSTQDDHEAAHGYVACLREWLEGQFADFLAPSSKVLITDPSLATLIEVFRARSNAGMEAIAGPLCRTLAKAAELQPGSATLELLNRSHHTEGHTITYGEVQRQLSQLAHVQKLVTEAHEELERWLLRDEPHSAAESYEPHTSMARPYTPRSFSVPVFSDLAAFTSVTIENVGTMEELPLTDKWFKGKGLFRLGCNNFGFSAPKGSLAIVELSEEFIADSRLVIAQLGNKILARRLIYDKNNPRVIGLSSEAENPLERPASIVIATEKEGWLRLLRQISAWDKWICRAG